MPLLTGHKLAVQNIKDLTLQELEKVLEGWGESAFRARQIFSWIYRKGVGDFARMSDLSSGLKQQLKDNFYLSEIKIAKPLKSKDGTEKILFELGDKNFIEAVIIPAEKRITACISTQAGCRFRCAFCASGIGGFKRSLEVSEMIEQVLCLKDKSLPARLSHIVFMGSGEPLDNYDNVLKAARIINARAGLNIAARRITISTCGIISGIKKLAKEGLQIELSISLHAADDETRSRLMPVNKIYPLGRLMSACRDYIKDTGRQITFEYVLVKGINSDLPSALNLTKVLKGSNCKVNLIPANPVKECRLEPPDKRQILSFRDCLVKRGINVTLRRPRGEDIQAACGQLRLGYEKH